jgi:hypothetical protein
VKKILPMKIISLYSVFFSKMCNGIALIDTFFSTAAHHCLLVIPKAVNRQDKLSRRYRDRDLAKFESSRRYRQR